MRKRILVVFAILAGWGICDRASAHPASGIVVNPDGEVFFISNSRQTEEWFPRVRKLSGNGEVRTLVTISATSESATGAK